jgi:NAD(P)-dependent dehydrogenase (short-subunit alcohol dehydrogenase family)
MDLTGKIWLITGSTGIGAATAIIASTLGARVFVCGLNEEECANLSMVTGGKWYAGDLSNPTIAETAVAHCMSEFGPVDALFNVAGGSGRKYGDGPIHLVTDQGWRMTLEMNLTTMFNVSRTVLRRMLPRGEGAVLNMATVTAYSPEPRHFATHAYAASKGAVIALTKAMAATYAPHGIRVNAIAPGLVRTPMSLRAQTNEEIVRFMKLKQPLAGTLMEPEDIARAAVFLLSDDARHVTGQVLGVDAGWEVS